MVLMVVVMIPVHASPSGDVNSECDYGKVGVSGEGD